MTPAEEKIRKWSVGVELAESCEQEMCSFVCGLRVLSGTMRDGSEPRGWTWQMKHAVQFLRGLFG